MRKADGEVYTNVIKSSSAPNEPTDKQLWIDTSGTPHIETVKLRH